MTSTPRRYAMNNDRWKNRRRMAWASLIASLAFPLLLLWSASDQLGAVAGPFYAFTGAVVAAYIGFSTAEHMNSDKLSKQKEQA